jgi:hypothetical protein
MKYYQKLIAAFLCMVCVLANCAALADTAGIYANLIFESAGITLSRQMNAEFLAGTKRNCSSIYISSCSLEEQNADQSWSFVKYLTSPPDRATNTSNFGANANYASECTSGHTYRIKATFAAVYDGTTYTVSRTSRGAKYQ